MTPSTIGARIRQVREKAGIGSKELDGLADLSPGHTAMIEGRKGKGIDATTALKIANALGIDLSWLITGKASRARKAAAAEG